VVRNYIVTGLRCLWRERGFAAINIAGLSIGLAGCIVIALWVAGELSFDRFHEKGERLYRVYIEETLGDGPAQFFTAAPAPLGPALLERFPAIETTARCRDGLRLAIKVEDESFVCDRVQAADPSFLHMFSFELTRGDRSRALNTPDAIVLTETMARKVFGDQDPLGRTLILDNTQEHRVTAVVRDPPATSHLTFDCLVPFEFMSAMGHDLSLWGRFGYTTYVLLRPEADVEEFSHAAESLLKEQLDESSALVRIQPLFDVHLHSDHIQVANKGDLRLVVALSVAALVVLVIACINFVNLATARSGRRFREVGLRKVVGALRRQLVGQLMIESCFTVMLSLVVALMLVETVLPSVQSLAGRSVEFSVLGTGELVIGLAVFVIVVSLAAGLYPALVVSSHRPAAMFKTTGLAGSRGALRKVLVVVQSSLSVFLVVMTVVVYNQLAFIDSKSMAAFGGQHTTITMRLGSEARDRLSMLKKALSRLPDVRDVSVSSHLPTRIGSSYLGAEWEGKNPGLQPEMYAIEVDENFASTFGLTLAQGAFFSAERPGELSEGVLINQAAARMMGVDQPVGRTLRFGGEHRIIGVLNDFHFRSLHYRIEPLVLFGELKRPSYLAIRLRNGDLSAAIAGVHRIWNDLIPGEVFEYEYLDEILVRRYGGERIAGTLIVWFAGTAILIACLGLVGLSTYVTQRRVREIGIRKTLGASAARVVRMLCGEYVLVTLAAAIIAFPVAYFTAESWLDNFAYRASLGATPFVIALALSALVTAGSVLWPALRAARANPVEALRYE